MKKFMIVIMTVILGVGIGVFFASKVAAQGDQTPKQYAYDPGDYFVTDISGSGQLLKTDITIGHFDAKYSEVMEENNHIIRDTIIFTLRNKSVEDIGRNDIVEKLNKEIVEKLNDRLETDKIKNVYFNEFVVAR